jgi:hypothetical protein
MANHIRDCRVDESPATGTFDPAEPGSLVVRY